MRTGSAGLFHVPRMSIDSGRGRRSVKLPDDKKTTETPPMHILDAASQAPRPSLAGEGSGQTPSHTGSRGTRDSLQVSAVSLTVEHTHADAPKPRLA